MLVSFRERSLDAFGLDVWRLAMQRPPANPLARENIDYTLKVLEALNLMNQLAVPYLPQLPPPAEIALPAPSSGDEEESPLAPGWVGNRSLLGACLLGPWTPNAYGPGVHS